MSPNGDIFKESRHAQRFGRHRVLWTKTESSPQPPAVPDGHAVEWIEPGGRHWVYFGNPFPRIRCEANVEAWEDPARWERLNAQTNVAVGGAAAAGKSSVRVHSGSIAWSPYRARWVTVFMEAFGKPSAFGELWYAEADAPTGPWGPAIKVLSHENYTFYNPRLHPELLPADSKHLLFEGTYTQEFADRPPKSARHDYNQVMYRLDLDDPGLREAQSRRPQ